MGLIGGSLARALSARTQHRVFGLDTSGAVQQAAREAGAVHETLTQQTLPACSLVLVALYPQDAVRFVAEHAHQFGEGRGGGGLLRRETGGVRTA